MSHSACLSCDVDGIMSSNRSVVTPAGSLTFWTYHVTSAAGVTATLEDRPLAVNDRHVGQWQHEDDCKERRTEPHSVVMSTSSWTISLAASSVPRWCPRT